MGLSRDPTAAGAPICASGKAIYTKSGAKSAAKRMERRHKRSVSAYRCELCKGWHVGNTPFWRRRKRAA
jgi:hypothetical protein